MAFMILIALAVAGECAVSESVSNGRKARPKSSNGVEKGTRAITACRVVDAGRMGIVLSPVIGTR